MANIFNHIIQIFGGKKSSEQSNTEYLTRAVIKLWLSQPDKWTEKWTRLFPIDACLSSGYELIHKEHDIRIHVPPYLGHENGPHYQDNLFAVYAGIEITDSEELKRIIHAITEERPYKALERHRNQIAEVRKAQADTIETLNKIGCSNI